MEADPRVSPKFTITQSFMTENAFHLEVFYSGRVQGVGFRYQTLQVAKEFEVSGYVKNLSDGRVQMEVEGAQSEVVAFRDELERQMASYIHSKQERSGVRSRHFAGFQIVR